MWAIHTVVPRDTCSPYVHMPVCPLEPSGGTQRCTQNLTHPHACTWHYTPTHSLSPYPRPSHADPGAIEWCS